MNRLIKKYQGKSKTFFIPLIAILSVFSNTGCTEKDEIPAVKFVPIEDKGWGFSTEPVWADEFNVDGKPDPTKWTYEVGNGNSGWGNNEKQYYTKGDNANISGGILTIEARKEDKSGFSYTSTRMITRNFASWTYGRFVGRIKIPAGKGTWPAFWLLPTDNAYGNWPKSGEIDIMEHVGYEPNKVHTSVHTETNNGQFGNTKTSSLVIPTAISDFHIYKVDWTPYAIRGYVDDVKIFEYVNSNTGFASWPFNKKFFMILNVAVGGNWGGAEGIDDGIFPAKMEVDYVRVFSLVN